MGFKVKNALKISRPLVSDRSVGASRDWNVSEISIPDVRWHTLNIDTLAEGRPVADPDLSRVDEIGFTHQRTGGGRVDWIELYATPVRRGAAVSGR